MNWRQLIKQVNQPLPKPELIDPQRLVNQFEFGLETGHLTMPNELADFAALYQEQLGVRFEQIDYLRTPKAAPAAAPAAAAAAAAAAPAAPAAAAPEQPPIRPPIVEPSAPPDDAVLVPFTGGFSSTAALWQALREGRQVWLFYLEGWARGEPQERLAVREAVLAARDVDGCPLLYRLDERLAARLLTLPAARPSLGRTDELWHPHDVIALYVQVANAMRAQRLQRVLWAGFYAQRPLLAALARYFEQRYGQLAEYAHADRLSALAELLQAHEQSALTEGGSLTAGPTLGADLLHRCCACSELGADELAARQQQVPSPLAGVCGRCAQCLPWVELAIAATNLPAQRMVFGFGVRGAKPQAKRARKADAPAAGDAPKPKRVRASRAKGGAKAAGAKAAGATNPALDKPPAGAAKAAGAAINPALDEPTTMRAKAKATGAAINPVAPPKAAGKVKAAGAVINPAAAPKAASKTKAAGAAINPAPNAINPALDEPTTLRDKAGAAINPAPNGPTPRRKKAKPKAPALAAAPKAADLITAEPRAAEPIAAPASAAEPSAAPVKTSRKRKKPTSNPPT